MRTIISRIRLQFPQELRYEYISPSCQNILGYSPDEFLADPTLWSSRLLLEDQALIWHHLQDAITTKQIVTIEYPFSHKDGSICWISDTFSSEWQETTQSWLVMSFKTDITQRKQTEEALRESEERWQLALEASGDGPWDWKIPTGYIYFSPCWCEMLGYTADELANDVSTWEQLLHPEDRSWVMDVLQSNLMDSSVPYSFEYRMQTKSGEWKWIANYGKVVSRDKNGQPLRMAGIHRDVSDVYDELRLRKRLEIALQASESLLNNILTTASASIVNFRVFANSDWEYEYQSIGSEALFGYTPPEIISDKQLWMSRVFPEDREQVIYSRFQRSISEGTNSIEYRFRHKDGSLRWISTTYSSHRQEENDTWIVIGVSIDVSNLKRAEEAMRQSETLFRTLSDSAPVGIFRSDAQGTNIYTNSRFQAICGLSLEDSFGDRWMQYIHPEDLAIFWTQWQELATANQEFCAEVRYIRPDSTLRFCRIIIVPILSQTNELIGYVGTIEDITESRAIEKMKNEFISIVSHELRTPLASIRGALGLLAAGVLQTQPETAQQMLDIAYNDTERLVRLVNDILDLEHLESNKFSLLKQWCDAATLIRQSVEALQPLATANNVSLMMLLSSVQIWVDPDRMMQTLLNLIGNAIKFSPANSTVTLSVENLSDRILFKVQDQGRGIPHEMLETIFGRFQQVDASDSRQKGGTGLGLAICRGIVQQHGGIIWAESVLGEGSTFYFTIPQPEISY